MVDRKRRKGVADKTNSQSYPPRAFLLFVVCLFFAFWRKCLAAWDVVNNVTVSGLIFSVSAVCFIDSALCLERVRNVSLDTLAGSPHKIGTATEADIEKCRELKRGGVSRWIGSIAIRAHGNDVSIVKVTCLLR